MADPVQRPWRRWLVAAAALAGVAITASLGNWQLSRAAYKRSLHDAIVARQSMAALDNAALAQAPGLHALQHRTVRLRGRWLERHTVYLDNRMLGGRAGFHVLTPLQLDAMQASAPSGGRLILVQRGWVPRDLRDPLALPRVETPADLVEVVGRIAGPPSRMIELDGGRSAAGATPAAATSPAASGSSPIRQNLDLQGFAADSGLAIAVDGIVLQTGAPSEGLSRAWREPGAGIEKHYGYAFQWFGLSSLIAVLYVWFQFIAPRRRPRHR